MLPTYARNWPSIPLIRHCSAVSSEIQTIGKCEAVEDLALCVALAFEGVPELFLCTGRIGARLCVVNSEDVFRTQ